MKNNQLICAYNELSKIGKLLDLIISEFEVIETIITKEMVDNGIIELEEDDEDEDTEGDDDDDDDDEIVEQNKKNNKISKKEIELFSKFLNILPTYNREINDTTK